MSSRKRTFSRSLARNPNSNGQSNVGSTRRSQVKGRRPTNDESTRHYGTSFNGPDQDVIPLPPPVPLPFTIELRNMVALQGPRKIKTEEDTLDRIPAKIQAGQSAKQNGLQATNNQNKSYATAAKGTDKDASAAVTEDEDPRLLLSQIYRSDVGKSDDAQQTEIAEQSLFVRELIHTLRVENESTGQDDTQPLAPLPSAARARAMPVDCRNPTRPPTAKPVSKKGQRVSADTDISKSDPPAIDEIASVQATGADAISGRGGFGENTPTRRNDNGEKTQRPSDLKKDLGARSAPQFTAGASNMSDLVRSPTACPVSSFPVLVSGSTEQ